MKINWNSWFIYQPPFVLTFAHSYWTWYISFWCGTRGTLRSSDRSRSLHWSGWGSRYLGTAPSFWSWSARRATCTLARPSTGLFRGPSTCPSTLGGGGGFTDSRKEILRTGTSSAYDWCVLIRACWMLLRSTRTFIWEGREPLCACWESF